MPMALFNWTTAKLHKPQLGGLEILKYIGPGLLVTVGFIDPGNWASNIAAGSTFGMTLLWVVTLSTIMLIILQHNVAHLGIATGLCLSEAIAVHLHANVARAVQGSAVLAVISTALAEILGAALGLQMLFPRMPLQVNVVIVLAVVLWLLLSNSYRKLERWIIAFVSLIGLSFIFELSQVKVDWGSALFGSFVPSLPSGSIFLVMTVLGAVVMPHNLFLHSEIIQSRQWNTQDDTVIRRQLNFEFTDTLLSMIIGWAINSAMIIVAASTFFPNAVGDLALAERTLRPLLGSAAAVVFGLALIFAGISSSVTAGMAGGSIFAGIFKESYDIKDPHSRQGVLITLLVAAAAIFFIGNPFQGLLISQMLLSVQLPITVVVQIVLTSSPAVMGKYANTPLLKYTLWAIALVVGSLNLYLLYSTLAGM